MDSYVREIVTLQIGHYSNFIGTHWLNLQESSFIYDDSSKSDINHDYLFREGKLVNNQQVYIPRLLVIDTKGSLKSLPQLGNLYEPHSSVPSTSQILWSGKVEVHNHSPEEKNEFLKYLEKEDEKYLKTHDEDKDICTEDSLATEAEEPVPEDFDLSHNVSVWSDFLQPHIHPKTIFLLDDVIHQDTSETNGIMSGWSFLDGVEAMKRERTFDDVTDRIRLLAENCGSLQGVQLLCDGHDGMGGISAAIGQHLSDDYSSKDVFSFVTAPPFIKPETVRESSILLSNFVQTLTEMSKYSSLLLPLNLRSHFFKSNSDVVRWPYLKYNEFSSYESSSIFASFLDTVSVSWRSKSEAIPMSYLAHILAPLQRKVVSGSFSFPIGLQEGTNFSDWLADSGTKVVKSKRMGGYSYESPVLAESRAIRGLPTVPPESFQQHHKRPKFENTWQLYEYYLKKEDEECRDRRMRVVSGIRDPIKVPLSFPKIFSKSINCNGLIEHESHDHDGGVRNVPSEGSIYQGEGIGMLLKNLADDGRSIHVSKIPELQMSGLDKDGWQIAFEEFLSLVNLYDVRFHNSDNSD